MLPEPEVTVSLERDTVFINVNGATHWLFTIEPTDEAVEVLDQMYWDGWIEPGLDS